MKMAGIEVEGDQVAQRLRFEVVTEVDGKQYVVGVYDLDPDPCAQSETLEGPIPLVIGEIKEERRGEKWQRAFYPHFAKPLGINTSALFDGSSTVEMLKSNASIRSNFTYATIPFLYGVDIIRHNERDVRYRLSGARTAGFSNSLMTGILDVDYVLGQNPTSRTEALNVIRKEFDHASRIFPRNSIFVLWDEIVRHASQHPPVILYNRYGQMELIIETYRLAREIFGPNATLLYVDDYNYSFKRGSQYYDTKFVIDSLKQAGLVDGVGMEMHLFAHHPNYIEPNLDEIVQVMKSYEIPVYITEFDINQANFSDSNKDLRQDRATFFL